MLERVLSEANRDTLTQLLERARQVVVVCHQNPDGDAIGSMAAMTLLLRRQGKTVTAVAPNNFPDFLRWLPTATEIVLADRTPKRAEQALAAADLLVMLDFNDVGRVGETLAAKLDACPAPRLMIDHHLEPVANCHLTVSRPDMSSTCELLLRLMVDMGWAEVLTVEEATALYTGMMTDTGAFTYASNRPEIFEAVSLLLRTGIDKDRIYRNVFFTYTESRFRLLGYLLYVKMEVMNELHVSLITMTNEERKHFQTKNGATEGVVNLPLQMEGMKLSIFLREDTEQHGLIRVSTRSVDDFPCNEMCAEFFHGGGHRNAAGGSLRMTMDEAVRVVRQAVKKYEPLLRQE
ncbi:MAG: DHH family phosphoesterase [Bacteroidaceae bacterium]|nr:DHH family phosphoesterase [Bacteroidaceae bacterium]